ncbi:MAG: hypothetical protein EPN72_05490 [Nevskiaceae bacterium]|nr:MAG: hypothetical protein EPN63_03705 [Nevskiaceae bacterium]TBR73589.1 MAG: hypothetical protein EPN72_05490 [Nevskiaceae bacterium]
MISTAALATLLLMVVLGIRHGLDPEHIAIVNSVTLHAVETRRRWPAASGAWFALGHGLVITIVAAGVVGMLDVLQLPRWVLMVSEWLPLAILLVVAVVNLNELLHGRGDYQPVAVKQRLLPRGLGDSSSPLAVFCIGMLFAPFVDPATQVAVWGYAVSVTGSVLWIIGLGLLLTLAMAVTCVLEARAVVYLMRGVDAERAARRRRGVGWLIVVFSFAVVGYGLVAAIPAPAGAWWLRVLAGLAAGGALAVVCAGLLWVFIAAVRRTRAVGRDIAS